MFPCEMARYIAGFSPEARKSGPFCRRQAIEPGAATRKYGVEELEFSRRADSAQSLISRRDTAKSGTGPGTGLQTTKPRRIGSAGCPIGFRCSLRRENLLQRGVDIAELGAQVATNAVDGRDNSQRDTGCDQAIFNGGSPRFVGEKPQNDLLQSCLPCTPWWRGRRPDYRAKNCKTALTGHLQFYD